MQAKIPSKLSVKKTSLGLGGAHEVLVGEKEGHMKLKKLSSDVAYTMSYIRARTSMA
jgi:hypothetical protein